MLLKAYKHALKIAKSIFYRKNEINLFNENNLNTYHLSIKQFR